MEFICKKTTELTDDELSQLSVLFESVFQKQRDKTFFVHQYTNNVLGYSYHSLIIDNDTIVGLNSYIPAYFWYSGKKRLFANSVDSMVAKPYRDFFSYQDMVESAYQYMRKENVEFVYGYPNDNAYPIVIKSRLMEDIGMMDTYCLPYRIGGVKPGLKWLNPLSRMLTRLYVYVSGLLSQKKETEFPISKDMASYNATRYRRGNGKYTVMGDDRNGFAYKVMEYEGIRCAFLIDVWPKSPRSFNRAVSHILKVDQKAFDLLLYPGHLPFGNTSMIKLPLSMNPKKFHFTGKILDPTLRKEDVFSIEAWDTNLSNYDLL
jgi:hypothetical protein